MGKINSSWYTSTTDEWATPQAFFDCLNATHHFTLDPCATPSNAKCQKYYTRADDGFDMEDLVAAAQSPKEELLDWWENSEHKPTKKEISDRFGVSERTAQNWKNELGLSNKRSLPTKK